MNYGHFGILEEPDWVDETGQEDYCEAVATDDGACFIDSEGKSWRCWIESDLTIPLGDAR